MNEIKNIPVKSVANARDFGGIETADGRRIKPHRLIRSGHLSKIKPKDIIILRDEYGLKKVYDLRSPAESMRKPDPPITGVDYISIPYFDETNLGLTSGMGTDLLTVIKSSPSKSEISKNVPDLTLVYPLFASSDFSVAQAARCVKEIMKNREGSVLFHCTAGKDRTGITAAILLKILGVPDETIFEDYLHTNVHFEKISDRYGRLIHTFLRDAEVERKTRTALLAKREFLESYYKGVAEKYGSFEKYISDGLKITQEETESFRNSVLE